MREKWRFAFVSMAAIWLDFGAATAEPPKVVAPRSALQPVPFERVLVQDHFWSPRIAIDQQTTIPRLFDTAEEQGKIDNLRIIAGRKTEGRIRPYNSPDSDICKLMEAASYTLAWRQNSSLDAQLDELIALYEEVQDEEGYVNQMFMLPDDHPQNPERAANHRLGYGVDQRFRGTIDQWPTGISQFYVAGHLFEAAAAHYRATGRIPASSSDRSLTRLARWPKKGTSEWVQVTWNQPQTADRVQIFWFADHPGGGCKLPVSARLPCRNGDDWKPVPHAEAVPTTADKMHTIRFTPLQTKGLRIEVQLEEGFSGGIHQWVVPPTPNTYRLRVLSPTGET